MDNYRHFLIYWTLLLGIGFVQGDPRIDEFNKENLIEYHYRYAVDESKSKGPVMDRWEHRIGEYVKGAYSVVDPDGRVRTVDYEVDGKKGYHAVIRMNEPGPELLSYQQLTKSAELFPEAPLPTPDAFNSPSQNLSPPDSDGKAWNYHSNTPYLSPTGTKAEQKETAASQLTAKTAILRSLQSLPFSPANYNVPQTTNLIYFRTPAASIYHQTFQPVKRNSLLNTLKTENIFPIAVDTEEYNALPRRRRNSKLVKRFKSFSDVLS